MLILPERNVARGKFLMPQLAKQWRQSSQRSGLYQIENQTRFVLTALDRQRSPVWRGYFDDREDADAFLLAGVSGSLFFQPALWDLPVETWMPGYGYGNVGWRPDLGDDLIYDFATVSFLTTTSGSNQTYSVPNDWANSNNFADTIGAGSGTGAPSANAFSGGGGAGGGWSRTANLTLTPGGSATYRVSAGSAASSAAAGPDCWFSNTGSAPTSTSEGSLAKGGGAASNSTGGTGGASGSGIGTTKNSGGNGGTGGGAGPGGGGAGGQNGTGGAGGTTTNPGAPLGAGGGGGSGGGSAGDPQTTSTGGKGGNNSGGSGGGAASSAAANPGTLGGGGGGSGAADGATTRAGGAGSTAQEYDSTHGSGGGSGGGNFWGSGAVGGNSGSPGLYGAGGGGPGVGTMVNGTGVAGAQAMAVTSYTPPAASMFPVSFPH